MNSQKVKSESTGIRTRDSASGGLRATTTLWILSFYIITKDLYSVDFYFVIIILSSS